MRGIRFNHNSSCSRLKRHSPQRIFQSTITAGRRVSRLAQYDVSGTYHEHRLWKANPTPRLT